MTLAPEWRLKLPPGVDSLESRALLLVLERWDSLPVERVLVWHIDSTVDDALLHISEMLGLSVIDFQAGPPRELLAQAVKLLKAAGTPGAMKAVIRALGYDASVFELNERTQMRYDGAHRYNGIRNYGHDGHWSHFFVVLDAVDDGHLPSVAALRELWSVIDAWKPARCPFGLIVRVAGIERVVYRTVPLSGVP